jgi:hypothetical protein
MALDMDERERLIEAFLEEMRRRYAQEVEAVGLPDGTLEYVRRRVQEGDIDTLLFMLKLGWLMGLQTGFAAGRAGDDMPSGGPGPIQA